MSITEHMKEIRILSGHVSNYVEVIDDYFPGGWASLAIREDGEVGIVTESGYDTARLEDLPEKMQQQLQGVKANDHN
jgi:hypothetical protein|tara:strand:+ start:281 stop:511 length:231 start_codon:yes stop_codon:yes gene_type:complete